MKAKLALIAVLLFSSVAIAQTTYAHDLIPSTTGYNLGHDSQRWNAFIQNLDISGQTKTPFLGYQQCLEVDSNGIMHGTRQKCGTPTGGGGGGTTQVNSDWTETNSLLPSFILHKPTIPSQLVLQSGGSNLTPLANVDRIEAGTGIAAYAAGNILTISATAGFTTPITAPVAGTYAIVYPSAVSSYTGGNGTVTATPNSAFIWRVYGSPLSDWDVWSQWGGFALPSYVSAGSVTAIYAVQNSLANNTGGNHAVKACQGTISFNAVINCSGSAWSLSGSTGQASTLIASGGAASSFNFSTLSIAADNIASTGGTFNDKWYVNTVALIVYYSGTQQVQNPGIQITAPIYYNVATDAIGMLPASNNNDGYLTAADHALFSASSGGSMTWPSGGAGVPNYSGSSSWGTSYSASNPFPATFIPLPTTTTIGGVEAKDCSGTGHVQKINNDGTITCSADSGGSGTYVLKSGDTMTGSLAVVTPLPPGAATGSLSSVATYGPNAIIKADTCVFEGDSITSGYGLSAGQDWPTQFLGIGTWSTCTPHNVATSGETIQQMVTEYASQVHPYAPTGGQTAIVTLLAGTNNIGSTSDDAATIYTAISGYWATARADGFKVVAFTIPPTCCAWSAARNAVRNSVNASIRAASGSYDYLIDADRLFSIPADQVLFQDGIHPTAFGANLLANYVTQTLSTKLPPPLTGSPQGVVASDGAANKPPVSFVNNSLLGFYRNSAYGEKFAFTVGGQDQGAFGYGSDSHTVDPGVWTAKCLYFANQAITVGYGYQYNAMASQCPFDNNGGMLLRQFPSTNPFVFVDTYHSNTDYGGLSITGGSGRMTVNATRVGSSGDTYDELAAGSDNGRSYLFAGNGWTVNLGANPANGWTDGYNIIVTTPTSDGGSRTTVLKGIVKLAGVTNASILGTSSDGTIQSSSAVVPIANGGTGQTTQQAAMDALAGTQGNGKYLRSDGTHTTLSLLVGGDIPNNGANTTGNAATATLATTAIALAANGTNCSAGNYPLGVDAQGNAESCTALPPRPFVIPAEWNGIPPSGQVLRTFIVPTYSTTALTITIPANCAQFGANVTTAATGSTAFTVKKGATTICTLTVSASCTGTSCVTAGTGGSQTTLTSNDILTISGGGDATLAGISFSISASATGGAL